MENFTISKAIYSKKYLKEMNISLIFPIDFSFKKGTLLLTGSNEYQVFLNGKLIAYGPAKAAHKHHRVEKININSSNENNRILILLSGYNVYCYDRVNETPFVQYELYNSENKLCSFSNLNSPCYLNESRYQKVVRFSIQRTFTESYNDKIDLNIFNYNNAIKFEKLSLKFVNSGILLNKNINSAKLEYRNFDPVQSENFQIDESIIPYDISYMHIKDIGIFEMNDLDINSNKIASQYVIKNTEKPLKTLLSYQSTTFKYDYSLTGFIRLDITVKRKSVIYILFDEVNTSSSKDTIDFKFYRNTTNNCITYELNEGKYDLVSFAPYTAKYIRVLCLSGEIEIENVGQFLLENPDTNSFEYSMSNKDIEKIFDAGVRTFACNSVDILTDCPSRERAGWLCDSFFSGKSELLMTGYNKVETSFLENYADFKHNYCNVPKGMIPMCYPSDSWNGVYIPNWAMFYVIELNEYKNRDCSNAVIDKSKNNVLGLIKFFKNKENEFGLLENLESWVFVEWSKENDPDHIQGVNIPTNILYSEFLISAGELYSLPKLKEKGIKIKDWIKNNAYNGQFFVDNLIRDSKNNLCLTNNIGETTQYYAIYFDVVNMNTNSEFVDNILKNFGPFRNIDKVFPNIYQSNMIVGNMFRLEILNKLNLCSKTISETIKLCLPMAETTGTLWEHNDIKDSLNHCFASCVVVYLVEAMSGLYQIDVQNRLLYFKKVDYLEDFEFTIPIKDEKIRIVGNNGKINIKAPNNYKIIRV